MRNVIHRFRQAVKYVTLTMLFLAVIAVTVFLVRISIELEPGRGYEESRETKVWETKETVPEKEKTGQEENGEIERYESGENCYVKQEQEAEEEEEESVPYVPPSVMLASDLHYLSPSSHDGGEAFWNLVEKDDGKPSQYSEPMVDALLEEAVKTRPDALILAGDITHNGEKINHLELAEKLRKVQEAGVPVLVIPGNHDINNPYASVYFGETKSPAESLQGAEEFLDIYHEFGYDGASSRDPASLSYLYQLDSTHWVMMLDSCQYEERNLVSGILKEETLLWAEEQLKLAEEAGATVLPVAHHNLLQESRLYKTQCTLENSSQVIELFEKYQIPLYISGHLHAQRIKKHKQEPGMPEDTYGITEIVLGPYSIPPCQYGWMRWNEEDRMEFDTRETDVSGWAKEQGSTDENLLNFDQAGRELVRQVVRNQMEEEHFSVSQELADRMTGLYSNLYVDYCAGYPIDRALVTSSQGYGLWLRVASDNRYVKKMDEILDDNRMEHRTWRQ